MTIDSLLIWCIIYVLWHTHMIIIIAFLLLFRNTRSYLFQKIGSTLPKEMYTTIYASPRLMILNADFNEAFWNACLYGWCYADIFVGLVYVCPYLCLSFILSLSLPCLCCIPFPSCSVLEFFDGWQILIGNFSSKRIKYKPEIFTGYYAYIWTIF